MEPHNLSARLRQIAKAIDNSKKPSASLVAGDLKKVLAAILTPEDLIAEVHEDKSEQMRQLALAHLSDTENIKRQALESLNKQLRGAKWKVESDVDSASAYTSMYVSVNSVEIPVTISVGSFSVEISFGKSSYGRGADISVESDSYPEDLEGAGLSEEDFDEFGEAYLKEYEQFDWDPILEWLAGESDAESSGKDAMSDNFDTEPTYGYYDLRGRG